ncbi:MAG TPA: RsmE family RNA methyltransferase [Kofleriaceae bacterium]
MNLLLVERTEIADDGTVVLARTDRRAEHLSRVLGVAVGSTVKTGVVGGALGTSTVAAITDGDVRLAVTLGTTHPAPLPIELVVAIPRPKVLSRLLESCASFGVSRIDLTNAWRVDKSYLSSPRLAPAALAEDLRLGAEQGATTYIPPIDVHTRLMSLLDSRFPSPSGTRLLAHPDAPPIEQAKITWPLTLAIGPEGGWIQRELDTFVERGFQLVSIGAPILRTADAVAAALGQLMLLRRRYFE